MKIGIAGTGSADAVFAHQHGGVQVVADVAAQIGPFFKRPAENLGAPFETLKAANSLKAAGFDDRQAEAVVTTVGGAMVAKLVTRPDLKSALEPMVTKDDLRSALEPMVTKDDLRSALEPMVTKDDLRSALEPMVTKEELHCALEPMVSREYLHRELTLLQQRLTIRLGGLLVAGISSLAVLIGCH